MQPEPPLTVGEPRVSVQSVRRSGCCLSPAPVSHAAGPPLGFGSSRDSSRITRRRADATQNPTQPPRNPNQPTQTPTRNASVRFIRRAGAILAALLVAGFVHSPLSPCLRAALAAEIDPAPLRVSKSGADITVEGGHFALTWSAARAGDLTSIRLHDGVEWHELVGKGARRTSVPGLMIYTPGGTLGSNSSGTATISEESPDRVVVTTHSHPATEEGKASALDLRQNYTVWREGAVFVDLDLELPAGAPLQTVRQASIGWPVEPNGYTLSFWHWESGVVRGSGFLEPKLTFTVPFASNLGLALGTAGNISNQLQLIIESDRPLGSSKGRVVSSVKDGRHFSFWLRVEGENPVELTGPYHYRNRWGFLLGRAPARSRLAGHRIASWSEEGGTGRAYPTPDALDALAQSGASAVIVGLSGSSPPVGESLPDTNAPAGRNLQSPGSNSSAPAHSAFESRSMAVENEWVGEGALHDFIKAAHEVNLRCLATTVPHGDGEALGRWAREIGLDGLYLNEASAHYGAIPDSEEANGEHYPAQATFAWGQALRRGLGPDGIIIIHTGLEAPDMTLGLLADGVAFGTERAEWRAGNSTLINAYYGGFGFATPCPLGTAKAMQGPRAVAVAAAIGGVPIVPLGHGPKRSAFVGGEWALPLWQVLRIIDPGSHVDLWPPGVRAVVAPSNLAFWSTVYRLGDGAALLVTANLSTAVRDSTGFAVDLAALGIHGEADVQVLTADSIENFAVRHAGRTATGKFRTDGIPSHGLRGYLFTQGEPSERVARGLDEGLQVVRTFADQRPPNAPAEVEVNPVTVGLEIRWAPAADDHHVGTYRIFRSADPRFRQAKDTLLLDQVYEEDRYRDLAVSPGESWSYVVTAVDVAGNESRPSTVVTGRVPSGERSYSFTDSAATRRAFTPLSGTWAPHDSAYGHSCIPDGTRLARSLLAGPERTDVDVAVKIWGPAGGPFSGGLLCRAGAAGGGYVLSLGGAASDELILGRIDGESITPLATAFFPFLAARPIPHSLRLVARGGKLAGYCDDHLLVTAEDETYARGRMGFVAMQGHVHFDNLTFASPGPTQGKASPSSAKGSRSPRSEKAAGHPVEKATGSPLPPKGAGSALPPGGAGSPPGTGGGTF